MSSASFWIWAKITSLVKYGIWIWIPAPSTHSTALRAGFAQDRFGAVQALLRRRADNG
jgi:hypothetical protein